MGRASRIPARVKPTRPAVPGSKRRWRLVLVLSALVLGAAAVFSVLARHVPEPPLVATSDLDPAIAQLIETTSREVRAQPRSGPAWGRLATVLMHAQFHAEAGLAFRQAERFSPRDAQWPYLHGLMLREARPDTALACLEAACRIGRDVPDAPRLRLAQLLLERGQLVEAENHLQTLLGRQPSHAPAQLGLARIRLAQDRVSDSADLLARCAEDPHVARSAQALLAQVRRRQGERVGAEAAARKAAGLPPDRPWPDPYWSEALRLRVGLTARLELTQALIDLGRSSDALKALGAIARDYPADAEAYYLLGWVLNREGRAADAEGSLREHLRRAPASSKGLAQLAVALLAQERHAEAVEVLRKALEIKPTWAELQFNLGYAYARLGRQAEAIARFRETLRLDPNYVDAYVTLADLVSQTGEREEPRALLHQALLLNPTDERARFLLQRIGEAP